MARDSSGTYTRVNNSFTTPVTGTTISSTHADAFWDEIESEMTDSYSRSIKGGMLANGTASLPAFTWSADLNTGIYRIGADNLGVAVGGTKIVDVASTGIAITGTLTSTGAITPASDDGAALGSTSLKWSDLFLASGAVVNFNSGNMTITHAAGTLTVAGGNLILPGAGLQVGSGNTVTLGGAFTTSGANALTLTTSGATNVTLPTTGTLATRAGTETLTGKTINGPDNTLTNVALTSMATQAAYTFVGNNTGSAAAPTAVDIALLTTKASPAAGDYVMISDQAASGAWKKATVASVSTAGSVASLNGSTGAVVTGLDVIQNGSLAISAAAGALTIALKDSAGSDPAAGSPVSINFRSSTGTTGTTTTVSVTAATSLVVSSGSTLGVASSTAFRLWIVGFNDAGTFRLGVINTGSTNQLYTLNEGAVASSTAEGGAGAADSAGVFYTDSAVTNKAYRILGYAEWTATGLTAGTWTTTQLLYVQSFGPGIKKPGDIVQMVQTTTSTATATTSSTYQTTNSTVNITPASAANFMRVNVYGNVFSNNTNTIAIAQLHRDATAIGAMMPTNGGSSSSLAPASSVVYDHPNTASTVTYAVKIMSSDNTNSVSWLVANRTGYIFVEEIMR